MNRREPILDPCQPLPASGAWAAVVALVSGAGLYLLSVAPVDKSAIGMPPLMLGFLMVIGWSLGIVAGAFRLPRLTGYIVAGLLVGPGLLDMVTRDALAELRLLDELALTFIALVAGSELRWSLISRRKHSIASWIGGQMAITPLVMGVGTFFCVSLVPGLGLNPAQALPIALLVGAFSLARSPAATLVVIDEAEARGPFTDTVLASTVALDTVVVLMFAAASAVSRPLVEPDAQLDLAIGGGLLVNLALSIVLGVLVGGIVLLAIRHFRIDLPILLAALALLITRLSHQLSAMAKTQFDVHMELEPLLMGLTCGIFVQNVSPRGRAFTAAIERIAPPIYVAFFALAGARIDIGVLADAWLLPVLLVVLRTAGLLAGGWCGARLSRDPPQWRLMAGLTAISQAGVSLGLAAEIGRRFPELGPALGPALVASVTINQLFGPVLLSMSLNRARETRRSRAAESGQA